MRISTNASWLQIKNSLPVFQSRPSQHSNSGNMADPLKEIQTLYGGRKELTREDVLLSKYHRENPISLSDIFEKKEINWVRDASEIPQEYIDGLNDREVTNWDDFRLKCALDFNEYGDDIETNLNRLAATYVTALDHINTHFSGAEGESYIAEVEVAVSEIKYTMANYFAKNLGGFFEENGFAGESQKIHDTILAEFDSRVQQYSDFVKQNRDYANLEHTKDAWLMNDVAYMAQELRKTCDVKGQNELAVRDSEHLDHGSGYTLEEISLANRLVDELRSSRLIEGNEEAIGLNAGVMLLKTNLFAENSQVSKELAQRMTQAVRTRIDQRLDQENARIASLYDDPYYDKNKSPVYDKSAIYDVSEKMLLLYQTKQDYSKAILEGIEYARNKSNSKKSQGQYAAIGRYQADTYWKWFYDNSEKFQSRFFSDIQGYDKRTSFQILAESWNESAFRLSGTDAYQLKLDLFSAKR